MSSITEHKTILRDAMRQERREFAAALPREVSALVFRQPPAPVRALVPQGATVGIYRSDSGEAPTGYLHMDQYRKIAFQSPADHLSIRGQTAAKGQSKNADDLTFTGSRMQRFVDAAFAGSLTPGCSVEVVNAGR